MILYKKQLFDREVKVPRRSLRYTTHRLMVMHPHTNYHWPTSKDKNVMARTRNYYLKKTNIWPWGQRSRSHEGHYGMWHTVLWSCTHIPNKYYLKKKYLTLRSKVKVPRRSLRYATHCLMVMHPHTKYHWPISKDKNVMARTRKYYLKNNYLTLRSKIKVPQRSLRYATHHLIVMHPHTKYNLPIWKDKKVMVRTSFAEKQKKRKRKKRKKKSD
jgi:acyl-CoA thioesterase FadM